jgi:2-polyprenyl-3-methyl-5-hydroxy-6-metoxy-1,4-benzoquinol methylase
MALEIARVIPRGSEVLDVGCGNGFIAHHLSAMLGTSVVGIDLGNSADAPIDYRHTTARSFRWLMIHSTRCCSAMFCITLKTFLS